MEASSSHGLKAGCLSLWEAIAQGVATVAPTGGVALTIGLVASHAGNSAWLMFFLVMVGNLLVARSINIFARRVASAGAFYHYAQEGLGRFWGLVAGWSLMIAYFFGVTSCFGAVGHYGALLVAHLTGLSAGTVLAAGCAFAALALMWWIAHRDIQLSTRAMLWIEVTAIAIVLAVGVGFLFHTGHWIDRPQLRLENVPWSKVMPGLVLAYLATLGYEAVTTLGYETKHPLRKIPLAVTGSIVPVAVILSLMAYVLVGGFHALGQDLAKAEWPLQTLASSMGMGWLANIIALGVVSSFFAAALGGANATARMAYSLARDRLLPDHAGRTHARNLTPHVAIAIFAVLLLMVLLALFALGVNAMDIFSYTGSVGCFGALIAYSLVCISSVFFLKRRGELQARDTVCAVLGVLFMLLPLVGSLYPVPDPPYNYLPYVFLVLLVGSVSFSYGRARTSNNG